MSGTATAGTARPAAPSAARYDVVVAGAGPAGSAAALALAARGRTVLLVHGTVGPAQVGEALPAAARVLLGDLGVADTVPGDSHLPALANRSVWGSPLVHSVDSILDPHGAGWHLDRALFDRQLREAVVRRGGEVVTGTVREARRLGCWELTVGQGDLRSVRVNCRWLVDATGRRAGLATRYGARRRVHDRLVALHLEVEAPEPDGDGGTLVEAAPDGWWYSALLPGRRLLLAFFTDADLPAARTTGFHQQLAATGPTLARLAGHRPPAEAAPTRAPAHGARLDPVHGDGWIAAGDAALAFDPLSSQGILTALHTGQAAGLAVHEHLGGDAEALRRYATALGAASTAHQRNRATYYGLEQRWPDHLFWARRHGLHARPADLLAARG
ncbi:NAD(P)/FAD-dependent oxidoreductase [Kitasatospora viridis]|uniref:NAD(P)/FAD-dependent oxidoreductase n=1 Tax=Kitasatospora viridis TaxID=281105 RepID=UPI0031D57B9A